MSTQTAGKPPAAATAAERSPRTTWLSAALQVLHDVGRPMRAAEIVAHARAVGLAPVSKAATPSQSVNRDLHAAVRRGEGRVVLGAQPGTFVSSAAHRRGTGRTLGTRAGTPRLPVEPLTAHVNARGGLGALGLTSARPARQGGAGERLSRAYYRARERGWVSVWEADLLCVKLLGTHACLVWQEAWWETLEEMDVLLRTARAGSGLARTG